MTKSPCLGCEKRTPVPNCHAACKLYLEWQVIHEKERAIVRSKIERDQDLVGFTLDNVNRLRKRRRSRGRKG